MAKKQLIAKLPLIEAEELAKCDGAPVVIDFETNGLFWWVNKPIGLGVHCPSRGVTGYIPIKTNNDMIRIRRYARAWGEDTWVIGHNLKFDLHFLGIDLGKVKWQLADTMIMVHLIDSRYKKSLAEAEKVFLGSNSKRQHVAQAPPRKKIWDWPLEIVAPYCVNDCVVTYQLFTTLWAKLEEEQLVSMFAKEMTFFRVVWKTERGGWKINTKVMEEVVVELEKVKKIQEQQLFDAVGYNFNWRSHQQLSAALYENLGFPRPINPFIVAGVDISRHPEAGKYNKFLTSTFILTEKANHPLGELVATLRETALLQNTVKKWLKLVDTKDNVIHASFKLTGTRTGRLSCGDPNLQNIASEYRTRFIGQAHSGEMEERTGIFNLRRGFIARPGYKILSIDYKQMEMRMFGILSGDPFMVKSLASGRDVHADVAEQCWGKRDEVHREWAKSISFGLIYGMTMGSLRFRLNMTMEQAQKLTGDYWKTFPTIKPWLKAVQEECKKGGYLRYWSGRYWREENPMEMYKGANALIQGGCADVLSIAAIRADHWISSKEEGFARIVSYVHDELLIEVVEEGVEETARAISKIMEVEDLFGIPFLTDAKVGDNYGDMIKLGQTQKTKYSEIVYQ